MHLGLPALRPGRAMLPGSAGSDGIAPRFVTDTLELPDANTGLDERPVVTARRNLRILFPDDALGDHDALQVAELARTAENNFVLRENYVPPCLTIGASEAILRQLRAEFEMLVATSNTLADKRRQRGSAADFADTDAAKFFQLGVVNGYIPRIAHFLAHKHAHPEEAYLTLVSLLAQMCTLVSEPHPKDLPPYDHLALGKTFEGLDRELRKLLEVRMDDKAVRIDLERKDSSVYQGRILDLRILESSATMFLGVKADAEEQRLINEVPYKVKIASVDKIDYLIANALRGVVVNYVRNTPTTLPTKNNYLYFQLDTGSDAFEATVRAAKNIAIFLPPDYPGLTIELLGLRP
jgi:type VI secretion system protein ImpJ